MLVQLNNRYDHWRVASVERDLQLLKSCNESDLDIAIGRDGISLRKLSFFEKLINFFTCGATSERLKRLAGYMDRVCRQNAIPLMSDRYIEFYQSLRKWKHIDSSSCTNILKVFFGSRLSHARKEYEKANNEYIEAKNLYEQARREARGNHPNLVDLESRLLVAKMMKNEAHWKCSVAETDLSRERGASLEKSAKGVTGTQFGKGLNNNRLTVIKRNAKDPRFFNERLIPNHRSQEQLCRNDPRQAEAVAFLMSEFFNFDIVPPTYTDESGYSVQLFDSRGKEADKTNIASREEFDDDELEMLQIMALFNYLTGDLDGKDDNWKIVYRNDKIVDIVKFDNGNSFPEFPVEKRDFLTLGKTYAWKKHRWAQKPIVVRPDSRMEKIINKISDPNQLGHFQELVQANYPGFFSDRRKDFMLSRLSTIKAVLRLNRPLSDLGNVYGPEHFEQSHSLADVLLRNLNEQYFADLQNPNQALPGPMNRPEAPNQGALPAPQEAVAVAPPGLEQIEEDRNLNPVENLANQAWTYTSWAAKPVVSSLSWVRDQAVAYLLPSMRFS